MQARHLAGAPSPPSGDYDADIIILALDRPEETRAAIVSAVMQRGISRHITVVDTIYWGSDYPHAEGTFLGSQDVINEQFEGVPDEDRAKMLGLTLGKILGFDTSKKLAPGSPPKETVPAPVA